MSAQSAIIPGEGSLSAETVPRAETTPHPSEFEALSYMPSPTLAKLRFALGARAQLLALWRT